MRIYVDWYCKELSQKIKHDPWREDRPPRMYETRIFDGLEWTLCGISEIGGDWVPPPASVVQV